MKTVFRFFMSTAVGVTAFSSFALADMHSNHDVAHKVSGDIRTRMEYLDNAGGSDLKAQEVWLQRARFKFDAMPLDTVQGRFTPEVTYTWGTFDNAGDNKPTLKISEAWMSWMATDMLGIYVGRQEIALGNEVFLGNRDWGQSAQRFDALRLTANYDLGTTHFIYSKMNERTPIAGGDNNGAIETDGHLFVLYNSFNVADMNEFLSGIDFYGFYWMDTGIDNITAGSDIEDKYFGIGARLEGARGMFDYSAEVIGQFGEARAIEGADADDSQKGFTADLDVGATFMERHRAGLVVRYANTDYRNLFGDQHKFFGDADVIRRNNIISFGGETDFVLTDKLYAALDLYYHMKANSEIQHLTRDNFAVTADESALGIEGNLRLGYNAEEYLNFEAGYALFSAGSAFDNTGRDETINDFYLQGTLNF